MENGFDGKLAEKLSGMALNDAASNVNSNSDSLTQVMNAVEAAEATIKEQVPLSFSLSLFLSFLWIVYLMPNSQSMR